MTIHYRHTKITTNKYFVQNNITWTGTWSSNLIESNQVKSIFIIENRQLCIQLPLSINRFQRTYNSFSMVQIFIFYISRLNVTSVKLLYKEYELNSRLHLDFMFISSLIGVSDDVRHWFTFVLFLTYVTGKGEPSILLVLFFSYKYFYLVTKLGVCFGLTCTC